MSESPVTNTISTAPKNLLDMQPGSADVEQNGALGRLQADALFKADDAIAGVLGGRAMPVIMGSQTSNLDNTALLVKTADGKQFLDISNSEDIYNSKGAQEVFDQFFEPKKPVTA